MELYAFVLESSSAVSSDGAIEPGGFSDFHRSQKFRQRKLLMAYCSWGAWKPIRTMDVLSL